MIVVRFFYGKDLKEKIDMGDLVKTAYKTKDTYSDVIAVHISLVEEFCKPTSDENKFSMP